MAVRFHVLGSGSSGNACLLEAEGFGVLIDFGLSARSLAQRMRRCGVSWSRIRAVVLSHPHTDHWQASSLTQLVKHRLPLYCHPEHAKILARDCRAFSDLETAGLVRLYEPGVRWDLHPECACVAFPLKHDSAMTCGFRFEGPRSIFGTPWAIGYAADLGCWTPELAQQLADVDLLGLEFNHDVALQLKSGRHPFLIRRVLSDVGHLSNDQAAGLLTEILKCSEPQRLRSLVQLHLSKECNQPELARVAARAVLDRLGLDVPIHTTDQEQAGPTIRLGGPAPAPRRRRRSVRGPLHFMQPMLAYEVEDGMELSR